MIINIIINMIIIIIIIIIIKDNNIIVLVLLILYLLILTKIIITRVIIRIITMSIWLQSWYWCSDYDLYMYVEGSWIRIAVESDFISGINTIYIKKFFFLLIL